MKKELLPIGSVVILKNATKKLMISGYLMSSEKLKNQVFDYCGCMYPEGFLSSDEICLFNEGDIDKVFYKGYETIESNDFINTLSENYENIIKNINE